MCGEARTWSGTDKAGVQASGNGCFSRPLDERSAVRKDGDLVGLQAEAKEQSIGPYFRDFGVMVQPQSELFQGKYPVVLMNLYGVPSTKSDLRTSGPLQVDELAISADVTMRVRGGA